MWNIFENPCLYTNIPSMNEELNLDVCVVVVLAKLRKSRKQSDL